MRLLVTGADGFVGRHAVFYFRARGDEVVEAVGPRAAAGPGVFPIDVTNAESMRRLVDDVTPDALLHLAGASSVAQSHADPAAAMLVNAVGVTNLLEALKRSAPRARVVVVSSGEVYGRVEHGLATEATALEPRSPYAASKVAGEVVCAQFARSYGLAVVVARPFNHIGAGQATTFVVPSFAAQIAAARGRGECTLRVGDLSAVRDFSHVADVIDGYALLLSKGAPGEAYNVASGVGRTIESLAHEMAEIAGVRLAIEVDQGRIRPVEIESLVGDAQKLRALGWAPTRSVRQALTEALTG